jgi:hypothetical protein
VTAQHLVTEWDRPGVSRIADAPSLFQHLWIARPDFREKMVSTLQRTSCGTSRPSSGCSQRCTRRRRPLRLVRAVPPPHAPAVGRSRAGRSPLRALPRSTPPRRRLVPQRVQDDTRRHRHRCVGRRSLESAHEWPGCSLPRSVSRGGRWWCPSRDGSHRQHGHFRLRPPPGGGLVADRGAGPLHPSRPASSACTSP